MKRTVLAAVLSLAAACNAFALDRPLAVNEALNKLDVANHTSAEIKTYAKAIRGARTEGSGKVVDVHEGRRDKHRVTILVDSTKPEKGYNVVLYTAMNAPAELKKGQKIRFSGKVGRVSTFRGTSIDIHGEYESSRKPAAGKRTKN
ncbi:MAG TPA: hypothetical protein VEP69_05710 [Thermodesulfovibrionales bacterium]|nr:hypothetical protein [Thermodesulfovibrionales bacterium]